MVNTKIRLSIFFLPLIHYDILEITYCRDWNFQQSADLALYLNADIFGNSLVVQWLDSVSTAGTWVWSLVRELRSPSHMVCPPQNVDIFKKLPCFKLAATIESSLGAVIVQSLSHVQLCNPMDCSMPGFPVLHHFLEFAQTHVHWVNDAIWPFHPLLPPSSPSLNLFQQLCKEFPSLHPVAKVLELQL